jgi:hypothetical protein
MLLSEICKALSIDYDEEDFEVTPDNFSFDDEAVYADSGPYIYRIANGSQYVYDKIMEILGRDK